MHTFFRPEPRAEQAPSDRRRGARTSGRRGAEILRWAGQAITLGALAGSAVAVAGCPKGTCILKVCEGRNCRCSISSCQDGAEYDTRKNKCRCLSDRIALAGACMTNTQANAYCGKGRFYANGGCQKAVCRPGDELDENTGWCVSKAQIDQVAQNMGVPVGQGQKLGCPPGQKLVVDGSAAACVPEQQTCGPDETWNGAACAKVAQCQTGAVFDPNLNQCVQYAQGAGEDELKVNVGQWVATTYGPSGGNGTPAFCNAFAKKPLSFNVPEGASAAIRITVQISFPDLEVAKGVVQTAATYEANNAAVPAKGAAEIDAEARHLAAPLIESGGRANAQTAGTVVRCVVVNAAKPIAVPASGGI